MASSLLTVLLIAVATVQVAFASYYSTCDPPSHPDNGGYSPYRSKYSIRSRINFYCNKGYSRFGSSSSVCTYYNNKAYWTNRPPVCKRKYQYYYDNHTPRFMPIFANAAIIRCPDLGHPLYGNVRVSGYSHRSTAYYSCDSGYQLVGQTYRRCDNGYWTGKEPVCDSTLKDYYSSSLILAHPTRKYSIMTVNDFRNCEVSSS